MYIVPNYHFAPVAQSVYSLSFTPSDLSVLPRPKADLAVRRLPVLLNVSALVLYGQVVCLSQTLRHPLRKSCYSATSMCSTSHHSSSYRMKSCKRLPPPLPPADMSSSELIVLDEHGVSWLVWRLTSWSSILFHEVFEVLQHR